MSNEKKMDCPYCGKEGHLYLNLDKRVFFCFKCGARGREGALKEQGVQVDKRTLNSLSQPGTLSFRLSEGVSEPPEYQPLSTYSREYLLGRGIHDTILRTLRRKIYDTAEGILFFYPDEDYWQVRRWAGTPRWVNPHTAPRSASGGVVYHLHTHFGDDTVVVVEGIGDALRVAPFANCAAALSSNLHDLQLAALAERYRNIGILLDRDVSAPKLLASLKKASAFFHTAVLMFCPAADPGEMTDEQIEKAVAECRKETVG